MTASAVGPSAVKPVSPARDVLAPYERPARIGLREWATRIADRIEPDGDPVAVTGALNNAALIFSHLGRTDVARWACTSQLEWLARRAERHPPALALAFQPYINIGRLESFTGAGAKARERFARMRAYADASPVDLGPCTVEAEQWATILAADPQLPTVLSSAVVIDALKSWFVERRYAAAARYLSDIRPEQLRLPPVTVHEGMVICLVELGRHEDALTEASSWRHADTYMPAVTALHVLPSVVALGAAGAARTQARAITELATGDRWAWLPRPARLRFLERLGEVLRALALHEERRRVLRAAYDMAREISDQVSMYGALALLEEVTAGEERRRLRQDRSALAATCHYHVVRRAAGTSSPPLENAAYVRLAERIAALDGATPAPSF
jgi:hypothetical protein